MSSSFLVRLLIGAIALGVLFPTPRRARAGEIDSEAYWAKGRESIARLGDGEIVWESLRTGAWRIWTIKLDGGGLRQLSPDENGRDHYAPKINPGGTRLIYLSLPSDAQTNDRPMDVKGDLHLADIDGRNDRIIVHGALKYNGWDRAVTWFNDRELAYIAADGNTYQLNLDTDSRTLIITGGQCWLPNTRRTHAVWSFNTFSLFDEKSKTVTPMPHLGGCQPYFSQDGVWGFWMRAPGGPIYKMFLQTRDIFPLLDQERWMPAERRFCYFPMVSSDQRFLAFAAAPTNEHPDYVHSDYDIFLAPIDPTTLEVTGTPVRYTFDPKCDRFPDVYQAPLALGYHADKAPFEVEMKAGKIDGELDWNFGDGSATGKSIVGKHLYTQPGVYVVEARRGSAVAHGQVRVTEATAPKALGAVMENNREIVVSFSEPVRSDHADIHLESGGKIERMQAEAGGRSLRIFLAQPARQADVLALNAVSDVAQRPNVMAPARLQFGPRQWPADSKDLVFAWETADKPNKVVDPRTGQVCAYAARNAGACRLDRNWAMVLEGGLFSITDFHDQFSNAVRGAGALSIELTLTPDATQSDRACVLSYGLNAVRDTLVYQSGQTAFELCALPPGKASHVVVTYSPGHLACYLNGIPAFATDKLRTTLNGYPTGPLTIGNNLDGASWRGTIEGIALYSRELSEDEARADALAYGRLRAARKPVEGLEIEAKLVAASKTPTLAKIQPYRSALAVNEYEVEKIDAGRYQPKKIRVAHWAILDQTLSRVTQAPIGSHVRLTLEPAAANPQLQGQYQTDTLTEDFDAPIYFATKAIWEDAKIPAWKLIVPAAVKTPKGLDPLNFVLPPEGVAGGPSNYIPTGKDEAFLAPPDADGYVNINSLSKSRGADCCCYAVAFVKCLEPRTALLRAGAVGGLKVWLNGKEVTAGNFGRYPFQGQRSVPVELKGGWNEVWIKTSRLYGFWGFSCDVLNPEGREMTDLTYALNRPKE